MDDRTVALSSLIPITLRIERGTSPQKEYLFLQNFTLGRTGDNQIQFSDRLVSKRHVQFFLEEGHWWIQDSNSRNGTFLDGKRISKEPLPSQGVITLGPNGPVIYFSIQLPEQTQPPVKPAGSLRAKPISSQLSDGTPLQTKKEQNFSSHDPAETTKEKDSSPIGLFDHEDENSESFSIRPPGKAENSLSSQNSMPDGSSKTQIYINRYFRNQSQDDEGEHTRILKRAYTQVRKQHARWYWKVIAVFIGVGLIFGGVAVFQTLKLRQLETQAADVFYTMKTVELELAQIEDLVLDHLSPDQVQTILMKRDSVHSTLSRLEKNYESYLEDIGIYSKDMPPEDRLILRMTRLFGESEVKMPKGFVGEVKRYIQMWRSTNRLDKAIRRAVRHGYGKKIKEAMLTQHMLPEFFYLCLQESEFDLQAVGPPTRFGIAKGPWQFLPSTGVEYGLKTGPLVSIDRFDPRDERHHFDKATEAAAKFLRFLYTTRAQASGLLVIASYNWGPTRISDLIEKLPPNPQDRNFWELLKKFKVPQQTKDYVFYIFSAAVIGEDPKLFGFSFDPPL